MKGARELTPVLVIVRVIWMVEVKVVVLSPLDTGTLLLWTLDVGVLTGIEVLP